MLAFLLVWILSLQWLEALPPPQTPPADMLPAYSRNGSIPIEHFYIDDSGQGAGTHFQYNEKDMDGFIAGARRSHQRFDHLPAAAADGSDPILLNHVPKRVWFDYALYLHRNEIQGKTVCVFGSMEPWAEAAALALGARQVVTLDYNNLTYAHPAITTVSGREFDSFYAPDSPYRGYFDVAVSASAFDHDGLGRYGDPLNADADLDSMAKVKHVLRPSGLLLLSVPIGPDVVAFNLLRRYGPVRLPLLLEGWQIERRLGWDEAMLTQARDWRQSYEPILVLRPAPLSAEAEEEVHHEDL